MYERYEFKWNPDAPSIRINGPVCDYCKRPLLKGDDGKCICCHK